ncbi:hypothetical protein HWN40_03775 [Methanolobus zinderi]|uniref:Uncharacterized protein n=1 Tax=Methanolobus zinderi TaxID=536044 RepID=A0A7D5EFX4_9EURY|nr:hypothetical protein [Methanolobus zinderi]QLC49440.1 hypothetical protein HWN40_03775 [Methanolobus zinderi]
MNMKRIGIVFLASLILMAGFASASDEKSVTITDEERLELITKLEGTNITNGEFIKIALPELYDESPSKATSGYYQQEKVWFGSSDVTNKTIDTDLGTKSLPFGIMMGTSSIEKESSNIKFSSKSNFYGATPVEVYVYSGLYDSSSNLIGFCAKTAASTKEIEVTAYKHYSSGTYKVDGVHEAVAPPGYAPAVITCTSSSGWENL